jgi:hypothetical protein
MPLFKWLSTRASTIGLICSHLACISLALSSRRGMHLPWFWLRLMLYRKVGAGIFLRRRCFTNAAVSRRVNHAQRAAR